MSNQHHTEPGLDRIAAALERIARCLEARTFGITVEQRHEAEAALREIREMREMRQAASDEEKK